MIVKVRMALARRPSHQNVNRTYCLPDPHFGRRATRPWLAIKELGDIGYQRRRPRKILLINIHDRPVEVHSEGNLAGPLLTPRRLLKAYAHAPAPSEEVYHPYGVYECLTWKRSASIS